MSIFLDMHMFRYMCIQSYLFPIYAEETQTLKKKILLNFNYLLKLT